MVTESDGVSRLVCASCGGRLEEGSLAPICPACSSRSSGHEGSGSQTEENEGERAVAPDPKSRLPSALFDRRFAHFEVEIGPDGKPLELGRGAMGVTYKAVDTALLRPVALKVIASRLIDSESLKDRFIREARAAAVLRHPNIASVYYLGSTETSYFYAMEFVAGKTLAEMIATEGPLNQKLALKIAVQVTSALAAAYRAGLVHRDIKPANLIVCFDEKNCPTVKVIDFGLVQVTREISDDAFASDPGIFVGTPRYASPEQFGGGRVDIRSDLYALGITLWEMLTKTTPFSGSSAQIAGQHLQASLPISRLRHLPQPVVLLLTHLLEKDPADRPQTPEELLTLLRATMRALGAQQGIPEPEQSLYYRELSRISSAMQPAVRDKTGGHSRTPLPEPWDFAPYVVAKVKRFTGREWLFQEIDAWRVRGSPPAFLIVGEPGVGKSAIVAALVHRNPRGQVLAYHCCRADTPATLEPAGFVQGLAAMFSAQLADYAAVLEGSSILNPLLRRSDTDPISAFEAAILGPLHKIRQPEGGPYYMLIDSLDEALTRTHRPTIVDVLSTRLDRLPSWLRIVATTRNDPSVLSQIRGLRAHVLSTRDPRNREDVRRFIQARLAEPTLRDQAKASGKIPAELEKELLKSSAGNFLFVTTALDAVESGQLSFDQIENLPPGLSSLYEIFFHRLFRDAGVDFSVSRQVLETVAAARELLTREQIAAATGLDAEDELPPILSRLASFVPATEGRYAFFHKSLPDWLSGWDNRQDQPFAGPYHVNLQKGWIRLANWCWGEYQRRPPQISSYCLRHLPAHLHQVGRDDILSSVLKDFDFLQAKLEVTDASALIGDYEYLPEGADLRLVQSAIRLSAHVLARDRRELAAQLTGRMLNNTAADIQYLLKGAAESKARPFLLPLKPSLTPPGGPLISVLEGHTRMVTAVAVTPDGRCTVTASWDRTLRVWELDSGERVRTLEGHTACVTSVAVTPDGRRVVSASEDRTLRVWDLETGQAERTLEGHADWVVSVAVTPDGRRVVSTSWDRTLRVWDLESGQTVRTLEGHAEPVRAVAVTSDGRRVVSTSSDGTLRVWDLNTGQLERTLEGHRSAVVAVAVTPDGRRAVSASDDSTLRVWDLETGQTVRVLEGHTSAVTAVAITPDGRRAVSSSWDRTLRVWDLESGQTERTLQGHTSAVTAVAVTPDGRRAVSVSDDRSLRIWNLDSDQQGHSLEGHTSGATAAAVTPDGRRAVFALDDRTLRVCELENGKRARTLESDMHAVTAVAMTPDGRRALTASDDNTLRVWDLESCKTGALLEGHTDSVRCVAITADGRRVVSGSWDRTLRVWDLEDGQRVHTLEGHTSAVTAVAVTPDGRFAVSASWDRTLRIWELEKGQIVHTLEGHADWVRAVAITPDGRFILSASDDRTMRLWEPGTGLRVISIRAHTDWVRSIAITPDGRRAVSASDDHTLRVWDLQSGKEIATFTGEGCMFICAVAPDGRTICAGDNWGRVHLLRLEGVNWRLRA